MPQLPPGSASSSSPEPDECRKALALAEGRRYGARTRGRRYSCTPQRIAFATWPSSDIAGRGRPSLHEALLFEARAIGRLGSVPEGTTVSDSDPDEQARQMSISATLSSLQWQERKINLLDTPGEPSFVADALGALRVCESAVFVVNAVMGVEVSTTRLWARAAELDIARMLFVNMLDRERADFFRTLEQLKVGVRSARRRDRDPDRRRARRRGRDRPRRHEGVSRRSPRPSAARGRDPDPRRQLEQRASEYREKLMDEVCEVSDALMERYLEGEQISHQEIVDALKEGTNHGKIFPVVCGVATRNLGTTRLLDAIVEDLPSPVKHGSLKVGEVELEPERGRRAVRLRLQDARRPVRRAHQPAARLPGRAVAPTARCSTRAPMPRSASASWSCSPARTSSTSRSSGRATSAPSPSSRRPAPATGSPTRDEPIEMPRLKLPAPGDGLRGSAQEPGRRGQGALLAAPAAGGGSRRSTCTATSRPASRSSPASRRCTSK